jgi:urea transport system ATP-binding protein
VADYFCILDRGRHVAAGEMEQLSDELIRQYLTV